MYWTRDFKIFQRLGFEKKWPRQAGDLPVSPTQMTKRGMGYRSAGQCERLTRSPRKMPKHCIDFWLGSAGDKLGCSQIWATKSFLILIFDFL